MTLPAAVQIDTTTLRDLSIECWRLARAAEKAPDSPSRGAIQRVARSLSEILAACGVEVVDFAGRTYDAGLVAEVIDVHEDERLDEGEAFVDETVLPTLLFGGQVLERGQIVVKRAPGKEAVQ